MAVVAMIRAAVFVGDGRRRGRVVRPHPPATSEGKSRSCENDEKKI